MGLARAGARRCRDWLEVKPDPDILLDAYRVFGQARMTIRVLDVDSGREQKVKTY